MVLWQTELRVSWRAQWVSLLIHGVLAMVVLFLPWPLSYMPVWLILIILLVFGCVRSQRRINACLGEIHWLINDRVSWQGAEWRFVKMPCVLRSGMLVVLRHVQTGRKLRLWLMADSMEEDKWRDLRRLLLNQPLKRTQ